MHPVKSANRSNQVIKLNQKKIGIMELGKNIFTSKSNLRAAILKSDNFTIKFKINYDTQTQSTFHYVSSAVNDVNIWRETFIGELMTPDIHIYSNQLEFFEEIWSHIEKYAHISGIMINGEIVNLQEMSNEAKVADAKKVLNTTEIKDRSLGMVKVMNKVDAKLVLEEDHLLIAFFDVVSDIMTRRRAIQSFGLGKYDMKQQMADVVEIQNILNKISNEMASGPTMEEVMSKLGAC